MSQPPRSKLADLKLKHAEDLAHCEGYVWHLKSKLGGGTFGKVYSGWTTDGSREVAVKVIRKQRDPKDELNLKREIHLLELLRGCEYVVHLYHVQENENNTVIVMERCDHDLSELQPFNENDAVAFLFQLAEGLKELQKQNIVHRDLKPQNILIKTCPDTGKKVIKLADFGLARHFMDEGMKPIDMTSCVGTPVYMAPEALRCIATLGQEPYDDKVDIWSIGALLYKMLVGEHAFYAPPIAILNLLTDKGDSIAFETQPPPQKATYVTKLPPSVNGRLSEPFEKKMNVLLRAMLKLDPNQRMSFQEFFDAVDEIITSRIEITGLRSASFKVMTDPKLLITDLKNQVETLLGKIRSQEELLQKEKEEKERLSDLVLHLNGQRKGYMYTAESCNTHSNLGREYEHLFNYEGKSAAEYLVHALVLQHSEGTVTTKDTKLLVGNVFHDSYQACKAEVLDTMFQCVFQPNQSGSDPLDATKDRAGVYGVCLATTPSLNPLSEQVRLSKQRLFEKLKKKYSKNLALAGCETLSIPSPFEVYLEKAVELAWKMVTIQPPMIATFPNKSKYDRHVHEQDDDYWDDELEDGQYDLVFFQPALYNTYADKKPQVKAEVGNCD